MSQSTPSEGPPSPPAASKARVTNVFDLVDNPMEAVLAAATQVAIIATDPNGIITVFNRGAELMLGYRADELVGRATPMTFHLVEEVEAHGKALSARFNRPVQGFDVFVEHARLGGFEEMHWTYVRKDGSRLTVTLVVTAIHNRAGILTGFLGVAKDVTTAKKAEEALRRSESRIRAIMANVAEAIVVADETGKVMTMNPAAERLFGYSAAELFGQPISHVIPVPDRSSIRTPVKARHGWNAHGSGIEVTVVRKDGTTVPVELSLSNAVLTEGNLSIALMRDITHRKEMEAERAAAATAADAANRAKSDFLANMSHEIRTPMNGIIGMTELTLDTSLTPIQRDHLETVLSCATNLLGLLNDILDFSKIEAGKLDFERIPFDLRELVGNMMKTLAHRADSKGLEFGYHVANDVPDRFLGDPTRVNQVLVNLVGNAIKFTDRGEVAVLVDVAARDGDQFTIRFSIRDSGIGISPDMVANIFQPFAQADASMTRRYGGTGLGLAICARLAELMKGRIEVESKPGSGSVFKVYIELTRTAPGSSILSAPSVFNGARVLIVDDNEVNRRLLHDTLAAWNARPVTVPDGHAALAAISSAKDDPYRLVLLDCLLPDIDGFEVAKRILEQSDHPVTPLMMLSSSAHPDDASRCKELGMSAYLTKPVTRGALLAALTVTLGQVAASSARSRRTGYLSAPVDDSSPLKVLVAEDNPVNQRLASLVLEKQKHKVTLVNNGLQAVEAVAKGGYDLVLMDMQMPEMDGLTATRKIREAERGSGRHIPILAMTANAMKGDREKCLAAGMDDYVSKPIQTSDLFAAIARVRANSDLHNLLSSDPLEPPGPLEQLAQSIGGDRAMVRELAELFLKESTVRLEAIRTAVTQGNSAALSEAAHSLKGSVGLFGRDHPATVATSELEQLGRSGRAGQAGRKLAELEAGIRELASQIIKGLASGKR